MANKHMERCLTLVHLLNEHVRTLTLVSRKAVGKEGRLEISTKIFPYFSISLRKKCTNLISFTKTHNISTVTFP